MQGGPTKRIVNCKEGVCVKRRAAPAPAETSAFAFYTLLRWWLSICVIGRATAASVLHMINVVFGRGHWDADVSHKRRSVPTDPSSGS